MEEINWVGIYAPRITFHMLKIEILSFEIELSEKCPYLEFFWSIFSRIHTKFKEIRTRKTPNSFYAVGVYKKQ